MVRQLRDRGRVVEPLKEFHKDEVRAIGRELGLPAELVERHPFPGPGLAIRVLCTAGEVNMERDYSETQVLCRLVVGYEEMVSKEHALLNRIEAVTTEEERRVLAGKSSKQKYTATVLPIRTVGVQGDQRSYSYAVGISSVSDPDWEDLLYFAKIIPRVCHNINRICYIFGGPVEHPVMEVTPTCLTPIVMATVRQADNLAHQVSANIYTNTVRWRETRLDCLGAGAGGGGQNLGCQPDAGGPHPGPLRPVAAGARAELLPLRRHPALRYRGLHDGAAGGAGAGPPARARPEDGERDRDRTRHLPGAVRPHQQTPRHHRVGVVQVHPVFTSDDILIYRY